MKKLLLVLLLTACGSPPPPEAVSVKKQPPPSRPPALVEPDQEVKATIETITVPNAWVGKTMNATPAEAKTWAATRENAVKIDVKTHGLVTTGKDAKAKMDKLLVRARAAKTNDELAKIETETKPKEGEFSREALERVFLSLAETIAPGEGMKDASKLDDGSYVWLKKETATEDDQIAAYRKLKAPDLAKKLAEELTSKMKSDTSARAAIADSVTSVLGENAAADVDRPQAVVVDEQRIQKLRLPDDTKTKLTTFAKTAGPGQVLEPAISTPNAFVIARGVTPAR